LRNAGVKTVWSCEGGEGHAHRRPTVTFTGDLAEARRVVHLARAARLGPQRIRQLWDLQHEQLPESWECCDSSGAWDVEFFYKFPEDPTQAAAHVTRENAIKEYWEKKGAEIQDQRETLWPRLLELEPELRALLARVQAGMFSMNDLWLTTFCYLLNPIVGLNREKDFHQVLSSPEAFDTALAGLFESIPIEPHDPYRR